MTPVRLLVFTALLLTAGLVAAAEPPPTSDEFWYARAADGTPTTRLHYFYSPSCPHCQAAGPFLDELAARMPWLEIRRYVVKDNRANARFYYDTAQSLGVEALSIPGFLFCRQVLIGFDTAQTTGAELERAPTGCQERRRKPRFGAIRRSAATTGRNHGRPLVQPGSR